MGAAHSAVHSTRALCLSVEHGQCVMAISGQLEAMLSL